MNYIHFYSKFHDEYKLVKPNHFYFYKEDSTVKSLVEADPSNNIFVKEDIHSDDFLRLYLKYHNAKKNFCSHVFWMESKTTLQTFLLTDAVMNIKPTLVDFYKIIKNAESFYRKAACLQDDDYVNFAFINYSGTFSLKNEGAIQAAALQKQIEAQDDRILLTLEQVDSCLYPESRIKKYGVASLPPQILLVPNIDVGNAIYKCLLKDYNCYGFVIGGDAPAILNSRSDLEKNEKCVKMLEKLGEVQ